MAVELAIRLQRQKFSMPFAHVKNAYPPPCDTYRSFIALTRLIELNPRLQGKVGKCTNPEQIIHIASRLGFEFSREALRRIAGDLHADCFPWSGKGTEWRVNLFKTQRTIRRKSRDTVQSTLTENTRVSIAEPRIYRPRKRTEDTKGSKQASMTPGSQNC